MVLLIYGFILFLEIYCVSMIVNLWRKDQVDQLGVGTSQDLYALILIAGLVFMTLGYLKARPQPITVWTAPSWAWLITVYFSLVALILVAAAYVPRNAIKLKLKDSLLVGVIVWAIFHLTTIGFLNGIILFGSF
jgi:uncharacterized membrane protein